MAKKIGILSTLHSPLLPHLIQQLFIKKKIHFDILIDNKSFAPKDLKIWIDRTGGKLNSKNFNLKELQKIIPIYYFDNHNGQDCINHVNKAKYKILLNCGTPRKLSYDFLSAANMRVVNVHPGVLPYYRGSCCVEWAILNGDEVGNTAHFMSKDYDEGPIIFIEKYSIKHLNNYIDVRVLVIKKGIELMVKTIYYLIEKDISQLSFKVIKGGNLYSSIPDDQLIIVKDKIKNFDGKI